ncbi:MAG: hypothetical protein KDD35_08505, partial [Bdellovibrionales bacterium]|nr:hypothetical protein [Bdellovibrionales bacterium]
ENLWSSYFGERPTKNDGLAAIPKLNQPPGSTKSQAETASSKDKNPEGSGSQVSKQDSLNQQNNLVEEAKKNLPDYKVSDKGFSREEIRSAKEKLKNQVPILTVNPGRKGTSELPLSKGGAPKFDFFESTKVKNNKGKVRNVKIRKKSIPLLDIGEEAVISAQDLSDLTFTVKKPDYSLANPLKHTPFYNSAEVSKWKTKKLILLGAFDDKGLRKGLVKGYPVTKEMVAKIDISEIADVAVSELMVKHLSKDEQALLTALIVNRKGGECPLVIGLLDDLRKKKTLADEASFHLGVCAQKMKLYSQAFSRLTKVIIAEDPQLAPEAIALLASDLPVEYEVKLTQILSGVKNKALIPIQSQDDVNYVMGKGYFKLGKYDLAVKHAQEVGEKSQKYIQAKYLLGISEYASKKGKAGIKTLMSLREWMSKKAKGDKNVSSLMAINIARILFNIGQYKESLEEYKKIGKDHSVWLQGLIEQGWAQVLTGDSSGAIGNMHSLHSPYFKAVYKPESYVVRTIGYLNICQYGDAYKSLARMEQEHTPWVKSMDAYLAKKHSPEEYYDTVKNYLRSPSTEIVDGLPFQIVREMGRSRDFLNYQSAINEKVDEGDRYPGILVEFNKGVKEIQVRLGRAKARYKATVMNLKKAKKDKS